MAGSGRTGSGAPLRFDTLLKQLVESDPPAWLQTLGLGSAEVVTPVSTTASTVVLNADCVLRVDGPVSYLVHLEFQSRRDRTLPRRLLRYNLFLNGRHGLPVESLAIPLWPRVDSPELSGLLRLDARDGSPYLSFAYRVFRPWEQPAEVLLAGGPLTLPLIALANLPASELPAIIGRLRQRLAREPREVAGLIWTALDWLLGTRYQPEMVDRLLAGVEDVMRQSTTFQRVLNEGRAEGRAEGARAVLIHLGSRRFGPPDPPTRAVLETLRDPERITQLSDRLFDVRSWDELLAAP